MIYLFYAILRFRLLAIILGFALPMNLFSQYSVNTYAEVGDNAVSQGVYGNLSGLLSAKFGSVTATTGGLLSLSNATPNVFSAYTLQLQTEQTILKKAFTIAGFYLWKPFSEDLRESDIGLLVNLRTKHIGYQLGLNSRLYYFSQAAKVKYNLPDTVQTSISEPVNLMYRLTFYQPFSKKMNFEVSLTNFDTYTIQQETNPMLRTQLSYELNSKLNLYSELEYLQAGFFNMRVNYFGLLLRGGVVWHI